MEKLEKLRKQLIFRSWHRGTREMDLLLGSFAEQYVPRMDEQQLESYRTFLEISDPELYNWYLGKEDVPASLDSPIMQSYLKHTVT